MSKIISQKIDRVKHNLLDKPIYFLIQSLTMENHLKHYIKSTGITKAALAEKIGISRQGLYLILEKNRMSPEVAILIENAVGIPKEKLRPDLWQKP